MHDRENRLLGRCLGAARSIAAATSSAVAVTVGTKRTISRVDLRVRQERAATPTRTSRACAAEHVDRVARRSPPGTAARRAPSGSPRARSGRFSPAASQASAQRIPSPPAFVSTATRRPFSSGWLASSAATSISSSSEDGTDDAGLVEERIDRDLGAGQRCGVRARRLLPGCRRSALEREDRLRAGDTTSETAEAPRVAERLDVHAARPPSSRRPPTIRAGRWWRRRPCCRSTRTPTGRGRATAAASRSARPSAPLCEEKPMLPAGAERAAKVALRLGPATAMPRQLGPISRAP